MKSTLVNTLQWAIQKGNATTPLRIQNNINGMWLIVWGLKDITQIRFHEETYTLEAYESNWIYIPKCQSLTITTHKEGSFLCISLLPLWLQSLCSPEENCIKYVIEQNEQVTLAHSCHCPNDTEITRCLHELLSLKEDDFHHKILAQAFIMQLVVRTSHQLHKSHCTNVCPHQECQLKAYHYEKIIHAERIIRDNLHKPCSLFSLSKKVGINDCTLKKGFKEIYGTTIFNYLNDIRMQHALELLQTDISIGQIADDLGYKNHSNFTVAFKRKFGYAPKQAKKISMAKKGILMDASME